MDPQTLGLGGGSVGSVLNLLGGAIGTYCGIRNTRTVAERRFMIRCSVVMWAWLLVLIVVPCLLLGSKLIPQWISWSLWAIVMTGAIYAIPRLNRRAAELRQATPSA